MIGMKGTELTRSENSMLEPTLQYTTGSAVSDEALMEAITAHRPEALTEFYSRHGGRLKSVIGNVVHEEGDADDVLQDILLQIWHEADHYSPKAGKLLGWVVTLARRRAIDRLRRKQAYCRAKERYQDHLNEQPPSISRCCILSVRATGVTRRFWPKFARWSCQLSSATGRSKLGSSMTRAFPRRDDIRVDRSCR